MARCDSEIKYPYEGLGWRPPDLTNIRFESERLLIRGYELSDVDAVYKAVNDCRPELRPWMPWADKDHLEPASTAQYITAQIMNTRKPETWVNVGLAIFLKETGEFIGGTGVHDVRRDTASCETGYWIVSNHTEERATRPRRVGRTIDWALAPQDRGGLGLQTCTRSSALQGERSRRSESHREAGHPEGGRDERRLLDRRHRVLHSSWLGCDGG